MARRLAGGIGSTRTFTGRSGQVTAVRMKLRTGAGGMIDKKNLANAFAAAAASAFQAIGEQSRESAKKLLPKAKRVRGKKTLQALNLPTTGVAYARNPAPAMPRIRGKAGSKAPTNLRRPWFEVDRPGDPTKLYVGNPMTESSGTPVPQVLERGGRVTSKSRRRFRRLGQGGEIRVGNDVRSPSAVETNPDAGGTTRVVYVKLRTAAQVLRANAINQRLYAPGKTRMLGARRYMTRIVEHAMGDPAILARERRLFDAWLKKNRVERVGRRSA